ncbi:MAG: FAD-dependent oxidoreductase, partial [bacterium]|nr:FAD-dependent oxidoreductase [bacterium]
FKGLDTPAYVSDPWSGDIAKGLTTDDSVLLLGSGLTAIDCALSLDSGGFGGRIVAMSRRGLMPHSHAPGGALHPLTERPLESGAALIRAVRQRADAIGWRGAVDALRPFTQDLWATATQAEKARFLRHLRPFWDVHRHRIAPPVADRLDAMKADGRLHVAAGKVARADRENGQLRVAWRPRGREAIEQRLFARVVNCTGPLGDLAQARDPLLGRLHRDGLIRPDALNIGIDVDRSGRAVRQDGVANDRLFVVGPMTRGAFWEIVAVPDIRKQVWSLARAVTGAHWVEAEGL